MNSSNCAKPVGELPCVMPWKAFFMDEWRGKLWALPCCLSWIGEKYGEVGKLSFMELWNSEGAQKIRYLLANGRSEEVCDSNCQYLLSGHYSEAALRIAGGSSEFVSNQRLNNQEIRERKTRLLSWPMLLKIVPNLNCNLQCLMCFQGSHRSPNLGLPVWPEVEQLLPVIYEITFQGGEVTLDRGFRLFLDSAALKANQHVYINLISNGTVLDEELLQMLAAVRLKTVTISVNAASRETYRKITGSDCFGEVLSNVRRLLQLAKHQRHGFFKLYLSFVVMRSNMHELPAFVKMADRLGTELLLVEVIGNRHNEDVFSSFQDRADLQVFLDQAQEVASGEMLRQIERIKAVLQARQVGLPHG